MPLTMLRALLPRRPPRQSCRLFPPQCLQYSTASRQPLSILFAGSDEFSVVSLRALHDEHIRNPGLIKSLSVLCRTPGKTGRNRDILKDVPIASVASSLNLTLHRIPAFEPDSASLPDPDANLLIAVSFGLKIPASVISSLQFGGLNVHPSLLPMFRGAAPIQRTILQHTPIGGVTIQTLHPTKFDRGEILKQTNPPMEIPATVSFVELRKRLAKEGARLLVETLREGLYDSDLAKPGGGLKTGYPESLARKVGSQDARVVWSDWTKHELVQRAGMFGDVWTMMGDTKLAGKGEKRVLLDGFEVIDNEDIVKSEVGDLGVGEFRMWKSRVKGGDLGKPEPWMVLKCRDGWVRVGGVKVEGKKRIDGGEWVQGLHDRGVGKMFI